MSPIYSMAYTLTRGDREFDGTLLFTVDPGERPSAHCPGCAASLDDVIFMVHHDDLPLTDAEIKAVTPKALEFAAERHRAAMEERRG